MMILLAIRNLIQEKAKLFISAGGIAAALILVLVLEGVFSGLEERMTLYVDKSPADIWIMQAGVSNMHMANTILPNDLQESLAKVRGVDKVSAILYMPGLIRIGKRKYFSYIVGYDPGGAAGGPWSMRSGSKDIGKDEVIVDQVLAEKNNLRTGDKIEVLGKKLKIKGFSNDTFSMNNTLTFLNSAKMEEIMRKPDMASYFLISLKPETKTASVINDIERKFAGVNAVTRSRLATNDRVMTRQMGIDIINAMSFVGFVIGIIVVGLTIYTVTADKARDYGILKAIGADRRRLYEIVFTQTFFCLALGLFFGFAASLIVVRVTAILLPELPIVITSQSMLKALAAIFIIGFTASHIPIRKVARIDPLMVFKS